MCDQTPFQNFLMSKAHGITTLILCDSKNNQIKMNQNGLKLLHRRYLLQVVMAGAALMTCYCWWLQLANATGRGFRMKLETRWSKAQYQHHLRHQHPNVISKPKPMSSGNLMSNNLMSSATLCDQQPKSNMV